MLVVPLSRSALMARLGREAMMRGPLPVRVWQASADTMVVNDVGQVVKDRVNRR
jgi:hypothetical protein